VPRGEPPCRNQGEGRFPGTPLFLQRKKCEAPPAQPKATGELEARMVALACGKPPEDCARWTPRFLAAKCIELQHSDSMSRMAISHL